MSVESQPGESPESSEPESRIKLIRANTPLKTSKIQRSKKKGDRLAAIKASRNWSLPKICWTNCPWSCGTRARSGFHNSQPHVSEASNHAKELKPCTAWKPLYQGGQPLERLPALVCPCWRQRPFEGVEGVKGSDERRETSREYRGAPTYRFSLRLSLH